MILFRFISAKKMHFISLRLHAVKKNTSQDLHGYIYSQILIIQALIKENIVFL